MAFGAIPRTHNLALLFRKRAHKENKKCILATQSNIEKGAVSHKQRYETIACTQLQVTPCCAHCRIQRILLVKRKTEGLCKREPGTFSAANNNSRGTVRKWPRPNRTNERTRARPKLAPAIGSALLRSKRVTAGSGEPGNGAEEGGRTAELLG